MSAYKGHAYLRGEPLVEIKVFDEGLSKKGVEEKILAWLHGQDAERLVFVFISNGRNDVKNIFTSVAGAINFLTPVDQTT